MLSSEILDELSRRSNIIAPQRLEDIAPFVRRVAKYAGSRAINGLTQKAQTYLSEAVTALKSNRPIPMPTDIGESEGAFVERTAVTDEALQEWVLKFLPDCMQSYNSNTDYSLSNLLDMMNTGVIKIPYFQRDFIWKPKVQEAFLESYMSECPVHSVFFTIDPNQRQVKHLVDGCQRLHTLKQFREGSTKFKGQKFSDLPLAMQHKFLYAKISVTECLTERKNWPKIFRRINMTSRPLNDIEMRRVAYDHRIMDDLNQIARKNEHWKNTFGKNTRFKGLHALLRAVAMHMSWRSYDKPMTSFLDKYCEGVVYNTIPVDREKLARDLDASIKAMSDRIGRSTYRLTKQVHLGMVDLMLHGALMCLENRPDISKDELGQTMTLVRQDILADKAVEAWLTAGPSEPAAVLGRMGRAEEIVLARLKISR